MEVVTLGTSGYATRSHLSLFRKDITRAPYDVTTALCSLTQYWLYKITLDDPRWLKMIRPKLKSQTEHTSLIWTQLQHYVCKKMFDDKWKLEFACFGIGTFWIVFWMQCSMTILFENFYLLVLALAPCQQEKGNNNLSLSTNFPLPIINSSGGSKITLYATPFLPQNMLHNICPWY